MRILTILMLVLVLCACTAIPNMKPTAESPEQAPLTVTESDTDPYALFFEQILAGDKIALFKEYFNDIQADNASNYLISAALVELTGDREPEILLTMTNDTVRATAQSFTQIYRLKEAAFVKFGDKLSGMPAFFKTGRLLLTRADAWQNQGSHQYQLVDIAQEVRVIESGDYRYYYATADLTERVKFEDLVTLSKTSVIGSTDENIHVIRLEDTLINLIMFNDKEYSFEKAKAMVQRLADMKRVNLQPLTDAYFEALPDYKRDQSNAQVVPEDPARDLADQYVRATDAKLTDQSLKRIQVGENTYVIESTQLTMSTDLFKVIAGSVNGKDVFIRNNLPVYYRSNKRGYYADDRNLSQAFAEIKKQLETDITRYYLSEFFLTDVYSGTLPWPLYQSEYFK